MATAHALARLPAAGRGQRIGLLGGSFNPAHRGHRAISLLALKRLRLDWVWWLVTPGNPLKDVSTLPDLEVRMAKAEAVAAHPRIRITGIEAAIATRYTADTLDKLRLIRPDLAFVWIMGADNLATFHLWERWRDIAATVPIAVADRPGSTLKALAGPAAQALSAHRIASADAARLAGKPPPAWVFLFGPHAPESSTAIRARQSRTIGQDRAPLLKRHS